VNGATAAAWSRKERQVSTVMRRDVVLIGVTRPLREAAQRIAREHVPALPVVDADGCLVGILSASDLLPRLGEHVPRAERHRVAAESVATLMSRHVSTVHPTTSVGDAADLMQREGLRHVPVVDDDDHVVGVVSRSDLASLLVRDDHALREHIVEDLIRAEFVLDDSALDVSVHDGVVLLEGEVPTDQVRRDLVDATSRCAGVITVHDRLRSRPSGGVSMPMTPMSPLWYGPPAH